MVLIFGLEHIIAPSPLALAKIYAGNPKAPMSELDSIIQQYHFNAPIQVQFYLYLDNFFHGNLGTDSIYKIPETVLIGKYLPITLELVLTGLVLAILLGIFTGTIAASRRGGVVDQTIKAVYLVTWASPPFVVAFILQLIIAYDLGLLPASGLVDPTLVAPHVVTGFPLIDALLAGNFAYFWSLVQHLVLPALSLAITTFGVATRIMRSSMIDALDKDYIKLAYMKGFSKRQVVYRTAFKNAIGPIITLSALFFGTATAGAVIVEDIFQYHGIGFFTVQAIFNLDNVAILAVAVIVGISVIIANLVADILYGVADPRIRME
jgi:ABC-type dipeptide/oligopeptide/nickel transport system permease component